MSAETTLRTDAEFVARVLQGDQSAYGELVRLHQERLYRHALGMTGDPDIASDLVQDSFIKAYTSLATCDEPAAFSSWVFRILRNRCLDYLKSRKRRDRPLDEAAASLVAPDDPDRDLDRSETRRVVLRALATLPAPQREAFVMKHVEGREYEEIARLSDVSVSALKMRVKRAREALHALLATQHEAEM